MGLFGPKNPDKLIEEGMTLAKAGKMPEAIGRLEEATRADSKHAQAWYVLGTFHSSQENHKAAVECYANSARNAPPSHVAMPLYNMGNALQALGDIERAIGAFKMTTEAAPDMADAWINYGRLLDDT